MGTQTHISPRQSGEKSFILVQRKRVLRKNGLGLPKKLNQ